MLVKRRPLTAAPALDQAVQLPVVSGAGRLAEALEVIDRGLANMAYRQIVTADEVSDLLLDPRIVLLVTEFELVG